jgi:hypothetical protein
MGGMRRLVAAALVGVVAWGLDGCSSSPFSPSSARPTAADTAVAALLQRQAHALAAGDVNAWKAGIADPTTPEGSRQLEAFDALRALGVSHISFTALHERSDPTSTDGVEQHWQGTAQLAYRIPGVDRVDRVVSRTLRAVERQGTWRLVTWLGATDPPEAFDLPRLAVRRGDHVVVAVSADVVDLAECSAAAEQAWSRVAAIPGLADGIPGTVLVVPPTAEATAAMIGRSTTSGLDVVGATTVGARLVGRPAGADRVVLGPGAARRLTAEGRLVVLAHEFTHVALRASTRSDLPMWLSEGLAEYVAYRASSPEPRTIAAAAIERAKASDWPTTLATSSEFDTAAAGFDTAYQSSWLAVRALATGIGERGLMGLIHEVGGSLDGSAPSGSAGAVSAALQQQGTNESDLATAVRGQLLSWAR